MLFVGNPTIPTFVVYPRLDTAAIRPHNAAMGVSARQFEQMQTRVKDGGKSSSAAVEAGDLPPGICEGEVVLGIDPSLRGTGFGIIRLGKPHPATLAQGTISCPKGWERTRCLANILTTIRGLIAEHQPVVCIIEGLFFAQNLKTALTMGEARGASLAAAAESGLPVYELATRKVKQAIVGYGAAQKIAVAKMVQRMLALEELPEPDAADALALALAHAQIHSGPGLRPPNRI